jgi:S-adenosylmethionine synthetase
VELSIGAMRRPLPHDLDVEIVERKGRGHPDTICDALAEQLSRSLCRYYHEHCGAILHHNVDKALLWGGTARPEFGGGEVTEPVEIYLAGRATRLFGDRTIPVDELAVEGSRAWFRRHLHALDPERHVVIHPLVRPGSGELVDLFLRQQREEVPLANDTSVGVGYAPLSALERVVTAVEARLNAPETKAVRPELGEDVKVLGVRRGTRMHLTVACALVGQFVSSLPDYLEKRADVRRMALEAARGAGAGEVEVAVNTADHPETDRVYLTVTGTSAEAGDDGQAGRGNRANGLITPYRPMTLEAAAGKNPVNHVGKLYQIAAGRIADALVGSPVGLLAAECLLVSQIGRPVADPQVVDVRLQPPERRRPAEYARTVAAIVERELAGLASVWREVLAGDVGLS